MDPTRPNRPIDPNKSAMRAVGNKAAGALGAAANASGTAQAGEARSGVSLELSDTGLSRAEARRIDSQRLEFLKEAIANDTYDVSPDALARRILDDALGPESYE